MIRLPGRSRVGGSSAELRRLVASLVAVLLATSAITFVGVGQSRAAERDQTIAVLRSIAAQGGDLSLRAWVNDGHAREIRVGDPLAYHFVADRRSHLTVVHVDSHGVITLLFPNGIGSGNLLEPGVERAFPLPEDGFEIQAEPPVGAEFVLAIATAAPIRATDLGVSFTNGPFAVIEASEGTTFVDHLREIYDRIDQGSRTALHFEQRIAGRSATSEYASNDIITYFETRSRSVRRPRLDLHIRFDTGSASLDPMAMRSLDEVAEALQNPRMFEMRFIVSGHTDDVGEDSFNDALSLRRAESVVRYLMNLHEIDSERLQIAFYGEKRPLENGVSAEARRANRRVEFELVR